MEYDEENDNKYGFIQEDGIIIGIEDDSSASGSILEVGDQIIEMNGVKVSDHMDAEAIINESIVSKTFIGLVMLGSPNYHWIRSK